MSDERSRAVWAVLPVKGFARGKSRLGGVLSDPLRVAFARGLFEHVAKTLTSAPRIAGVIVVTEDDDVVSHAESLGLSVLRDPPSATLSSVVDAGRAEAVRRGASAAFVCMADLPRVSVEDVEAVIDALSHAPVVVVPDLAEAGTNVLCTAPADVFPSCFGNLDSFAQHLARSRSHQVEPVVLRRDGLCFDVDGPQDLERI